MRATSLAVLAGILYCCTPASAEINAAHEWTTKVKPLLKQYCFDCHGDGESSGDLELDHFKTADDAVRGKKTFEKAISHIRTHTMPPEEADNHPTQDQRDDLVWAVGRVIYQIDPDNPDPGRVTIRRLNRAEYRNTVRDLLGVTFDPTLDFPTDDTGYGFDNIADVLTLPPMLMEKYLVAAEKVLDEAIPSQKIDPIQRRVTASQPITSEHPLSVSIQTPVQAEYTLRVLASAPSSESVTLSLMLDDVVIEDVHLTGQERWYEVRAAVSPGKHRFRAALRRSKGAALVRELVVTGPVQGAVRQFSGDQLEGGGSTRISRERAVAGRTGDEVSVAFDFPATGEYALRTVASADQAGNESAKLQLLLDERPLGTFEVSQAPQVYEAIQQVEPGTHRLTARYLNNFRDFQNPTPTLRDRNLHVFNFQIVELSASPSAPSLTRPTRELFTRHQNKLPATAARAMLGEFARRAWRRPVQADELDRLVGLFELASKNDEDFTGSIKHAMKAVLVSPSFLFRGEVQPPQISQASTQPIGEFDLASRLSYFLWSSTPDDELLDLAQRGQLRDNLSPQVKRMLASPKSQALVENFAGQWLGFRNLDAAHPDDDKYEPFNERLREAMKKETQLFVESIMREDRSLLDVLTADYTFVNERLAKHYGLDGITGQQFRRVSLASTPRRGVLTQASVLTLTSNPTRTSPVKRGKWVLENLLGTPPPPPPPEVPPLERDDKPLTGTLRQKMEQHRADPNCASCHATMDPIGFGLENFDGIGAWRTKDAGETINASSSLTGGTKFNGAKELADLLARTRRSDFYRSLAERGLTYALGRGVEGFDQPAVEKIVSDLQANDARFSTFIMSVVTSVPFQMQRAQPPGGNIQQAAIVEPEAR